MTPDMLKLMVISFKQYHCSLMQKLYNNKITPHSAKRPDIKPMISSYMCAIRRKPWHVCTTEAMTLT